MGEDAQQSSQSAQVTPQTAELRQFVAELAERLADLEAQRGRAQRMADLLDGAAEPEPLPGRHRRSKRDRSHLRVIPGGLAAMVPVAFWFHDGLAAAGVTAWQWIWRARCPYARRAVAALALAGAALTAAPVSASDGPPRVRHVHALSCRLPRERHPDRQDGDRDDRTVVARLPPSCWPQ